MITLRDYQEESVNIGVNYIKSKETKPAVIVAPTAAGKSLIIGSIANRLDAPVIVIQPSKELLEQNMSKLIAFGGEASIYSASFNQKIISNITFATIGSIKNDGKKFRDFGIKYVICDEAHLFSPNDESMFKKFIKDLGAKNVLGLTATPFRLKSYSSMISENYSQLNMLMREVPSFFKIILHVVQIQEMINRKYWSPLNYEIHKYDRSSLLLNSTGAEYTENSIIQASSNVGLWQENHMFSEMVKNRQYISINSNIFLRLLTLLRTEQRKSIIVFMDSVENAQILSDALNKNFHSRIAACVSANTKKKERESIVNKFKSGEIKVVCNFSAVMVGFDAPNIDCVIFGRPTNSLAVFYQALGRGTRISPLKENCLIIDACDNCQAFGRLEDLVIENLPGYGWGVFSKNNLLTGIPMGSVKTKSDLEHGYNSHVHTIKDVTEYDEEEVWFGEKFKGKKFKDVPKWWFQFVYDKYDWSKVTGKLLMIKDYCELIGITKTKI